ncbi:MAG: hypothetical protein QN632_00455 [Nitrososphaeraceae archaeon]|nr:hypothetical protein [Nitrososphaeraceae archaeon]
MSKAENILAYDSMEVLAQLESYFSADIITHPSRPQPSFTILLFSILITTNRTLIMINLIVQARVP